MTITKELIDNFEELKNSLENYKNLANDIKRQSDEDITSKLIEKSIRITEENDKIQKKIITMSDYPISEYDKIYI